MRALVFTGPGEVELQDVDRPRPDAGDVLLDVRAAGICGSELHGFRQPGFRKPPLVMGHEFAGTTPEGRRVVVNPLVSCGQCDLCRSGRPQLCRNRELLGVHRPGGFAESVVVPATSLHELPPEMSWQTAAMVEPLANAVHAWHQLDPRGGVHATAPGRVAIVGAGTIGLVCLLVARRHGLADVTVVDRSPQRLELARRLGATSTEPELAGEFDAVIDAVGSPVTRRAGIDRVRPGGTCVWLGLADPDPGFDGNALVRQEKRVVGSFAYSPDDFATALALAAELDLDWTTPVGLEQSREVFLALAGGAMEPVKAVIVQ
ncbi:alcohol dehydrogenase catalytic domain-containing protein [Rugosimonospora africana]|uniref:Alcohol dehydrogenase n=1 Tax=Rugosimonospora africana TaxID=556532 RepID=A0A8J3QTF6_9ACTN|nr:alcohol dehydrogenase catalytic domain-containing protein [Rugosimonospora africana]GIH16169.1 alcohol dehydrogenase [Rugosimonospora africana]